LLQYKVKGNLEFPLCPPCEPLPSSLFLPTCILYAKLGILTLFQIAGDFHAPND